MTSLAGGSGFAASGLSNGTVRVTSQTAALMAQLGMTSAAGNSYKAGQLIGPSVASAAVTGAQGALPGMAAAAGWSTIVLGITALAAVIASSYQVIKAFQARSEAMEATLLAEQSSSETLRLLAQRNAESNAKLAASNSFAGIKNPVGDKLTTDRNAALRTLQNFRNTGNFDYLKILRNRVGGAEWEEWQKPEGFSMFRQPGQDWLTSEEAAQQMERSIRQRFTRQQQAANVSSGTSAGLQNFQTIVDAAKNRKSITNQLDILGIPSGNTFTGNGDADIVRQKLVGNEQDDERELLSSVMKRWHSAMSSDMAQKKSYIDLLDRTLNSAIPNSIDAELNRQVSALQSIIAKGDDAATALGFKDVGAVKDLLANLLEEKNTGSTADRLRLARRIGMATYTESANRINVEDRRYTNNVSTDYFSSLSGSADSPAYRELLGQRYKFSMQSAGLSPIQSVLDLAGGLKTTEGMAPFQKLQTEVENAAKNVAAANDIYESRKLDKSDSGKVELQKANDTLKHAIDARTHAESALTEAIKASTTQQQQKLIADQEDLYFRARAQGYTFSTDFERNRAETNARSNWAGSTTAGFGEGFQSQFVRGDDFASLADAGIQSAQAIKGAFGDAFANILTGTESVSGAFKAMAGNILKAMADILAQKAAGMLLSMVFTSFAAGSVQQGQMGSPESSQLLFAEGGPVKGGSGVRDDIPALLMDGEYVLNRKAVESIGVHNLDRWNDGKYHRLASGGYVGSYSGSSASAPTSGPSSGVNITIHYNAASGSRTEESAASDKLNNSEMQRELETAVIQIVDKYDRRRRMQKN